MNGIIIVYKEQGFTSHDVVAKMRGILHTKKIGHTGTLDPDAEGVLPLCVGKATKVCDLLTGWDKSYVATVQFGITTDTLDMTGKVLSETPSDVTREELEEIIPEFLGEILQTPPMYSAIKVQGKRLYEMAREGKVIEREPRPVTIHQLRVLEFNQKKQQFTMEVTCSKGTYIRSLCQDIGQRLNCGAAMAHLVRDRVGRFCLKEAKTLDEIQQMYREQGEASFLQPVEVVFEDCPAYTASGDAMNLLKNGNPIGERQCIGTGMDTLTAQVGGNKPPADGEQVRMYGSDGDFYALYRYEKRRRQYRIVKMFHE